MRLYVDRGVIPDCAAVCVCLADFDDFNINRQTANFGDRLPHRNLRFLVEFIAETVSENGIPENPPGGFDVGDGIAFVKCYDWILMSFRGIVCVASGCRTEREGSQWESAGVVRAQGA